ncbi:MAG: apolipoprotein N-acyltransferase, partial [Candidatus Omnitrophica bacterium]|nr:apolipoprotein N-acyltransferase [Candidatus Omnitrophota bacterium]
MLRPLKSPSHPLDYSRGRQVTKSPVIRELPLCLSSAVLLILSFPNFNIWLFAWFTFVPLFFAIEGKSKVKAFLLSYSTGILFWFGTIYWLIHVTLPGLVLLVLYLALYFGIFGLIITNYELRITSYELLFIPSIWVLLEYIRSHLFTGFPWALLGYSQYLNLPIIQVADITGVWGVSFLMMLVNVAIYQVTRSPGHQVTRRNGIVSIIIILITLIYGYYRINHRPLTIDHRPLKISVVQGNIPQELKWEVQARDFIIQKYLNLTAQAAKDNPDLILWPEAALPVVLEEEPSYFEKVKASVRENKIPLVLGAPTLRNGLFFNSAILVSPEGTLNRYDKLHLVPFGEFVPFRKIFPFLEVVVPIGDFTAGKEYTILEIPNPKSQIPNKSQIPISKIPNKFSVLICFED